MTIEQTVVNKHFQPPERLLDEYWTLFHAVQHVALKRFKGRFRSRILTVRKFDVEALRLIEHYRNSPQSCPPPVQVGLLKTSGEVRGPTDYEIYVAANLLYEQYAYAASAGWEKPIKTAQDTVEDRFPTLGFSDEDWRIMLRLAFLRSRQDWAVRQEQHAIDTCVLPWLREGRLAAVIFGMSANRSGIQVLPPDFWESASVSRLWGPAEGVAHKVMGTGDLEGEELTGPILLRKDVLERQVDAQLAGKLRSQKKQYMALGPSGNRKAKREVFFQLGEWRDQPLVVTEFQPCRTKLESVMSKHSVRNLAEWFQGQLNPRTYKKLPSISTIGGWIRDWCNDGENNVDVAKFKSRVNKG